MKMPYSMQDWFLRIGFTGSCYWDDSTPIAETHNVLESSDFDIVINSNWAKTAAKYEMRYILMHECAHAVEKFIESRYGRDKRTQRPEFSDDLSDHDIIVVAAHDLPIAQWYDTMKWWVHDNPERVLHPSVMWTTRNRANELANLLNERERNSKR